MHWLGAYDAIAQMMVLWHTVPVRTLDELRSGDFVVGSFNRTHLSYQWAMLTKNILGAKYKVTTGYPSGNHLNLAMERGEIAGWTISWENLYAVKPEWLRDRRVTIFVQYTVERLRELPDTPTLAEISPPDKRRDGGVHRIRHAVCARAGGRPRRAEGPRRRAAQGVRRPDEGQEFLDVAKKRKLDINPRNAAATHALLEKITGASPELVAQVMKAIE